MKRISKRRRLLIRRTAICLCAVLLLAVLISGIRECVKMLESGFGREPQTVSSPQKSRSILTAGSPSKAPSRPSPEHSESPPAQADPGGPQKPEEWFNDAVFIGDSRTEGLENYDGLGNAEYFAVKGLMVDTVYTKAAIKMNGNKLTVMQAMKQKKFGKVFIMLGVNELGWSDFRSFVDDYGKMVDDVKKDQPGAEIYLQSILPVTTQKSVSSTIYNNQKIKNYNQAIQKLADQKKIKYLAVDTAVSDPSGALPPDAATDGIHLNAQYCKKWCDYLKTHTE